MIPRGPRCLLLFPRVPGHGSQVNGAYLGIDFGSSTFQPAEFAKIGVIVFLGELPARHAPAARTPSSGPASVPQLKHIGPLFVVWGAAMVMLVLSATSARR